MMSRFISVTLALCSVLFVNQLQADQTMTVKQLEEFVRSSVKQKFGDKEVAQYLAHMKLTEKLDPDTIETLEGQGAGPKTVAALKSLATASANLTPPPQPASAAAAAKPAGPVGGPPPSYEEEQQIIRDMSDYAMNYTSRLPDFLCSQVTRRYQDPRHRDSWITDSTVITKVSYVEGHENYEVKLVNNTLVSNKSLEQLDGAISTGEFGSMMREIFDPNSEAEFHFERWGKLRGNITYVFTYAIDQEHSKFSIDWAHKERVVTAYKGEIHVDKKTHTISRITSEAVNIPPSFPVRSATTIVDYDSAQVGTGSYILPLKAEMHMSDAEVAMKNVTEFRSYRKFSADSAISYDVDDKALDDAKTKEETPPTPAAPK
jgi:hypothetical protein